ncbi:hypothetical protein NQ314_008104 [Rhamnusium bicolor]|uniref:TsaA-like domain-containing protein n=1 Tax=Rhamnusium bicolor TaxID=1586634 RepID=A0AAV8YFY8_9CUCU|nr:hypothetical protein NQ314_008104 [Rhamnusium bicolor]
MSKSSGDASMDPVLLQNQLAIARKEIHNLRQQLISLNHIHRKECDFIYKKLEKWQCLNCKSNQEHQETSASSAASENNADLQLKYVGMISTHFPEKRGTPRQPGICSDLIAKLTLNNSVFTNPSHALEGLQEFSHMWILFHFHKNDSTHIRAKVAPPRLNGIRTGVFATRSPHRPCPIGLSLVKIDRIMENTIYFSGVDMVDQTPVLDIKPYIPQYDNPGLSNIYYPEESLLGNRDDLIDSISESANISRDNQSNLNANDADPSGIESSMVQTNDGLENINVRVMDGEENERRDHVLGALTIENNHSRTEESFYARFAVCEREAPDGEEEESPSTQAATAIPITTTPVGHIRVPAKIKKITITNVLKEDPRSVYLRERWGSHCYVFRIAELYVSCKFNDNTHSVTVYQVFQNEAPLESDE